MAKSEATKQPEPATVPATPTVTTSTAHAVDAFESAKGEVFGGVYPPLKLNPGEVSPRLRFDRLQKIPIKDDEKGETKMIDSPIAVNCVDESQKVSLPIGAIFRKHWEAASVNVGDEFLIKRYDDAIKKSGRGANKPMQNYGLKIVLRAVVPSPVEKAVDKAAVPAQA